MKLTLTAKKYHTEHYSRTAKEAREHINYFKSLETTEQDYFLSLAEMTGESKWHTEALAVSEAWKKSPMEVARRKAEEEAHNNELVECSRTGEMVARKDSLDICGTVIAKTALNEAEAEMFGIEIAKPAETKESGLAYYIRTGRRYNDRAN